MIKELKMKPDYKQLNHKGIPNTWHIKRLGAIGKPKMCKRIFKEETSETGDIPFFKIGTFGGIPDAFISEELFEKYRNRYSYPKKGEILISAAGTIGRTVVYGGEPTYYQDSNIVWIENNEEEILNKFLFYVYSIVRWKKTEGGIVSRLYNSDLKKIKLLVPPIQEQKSIANCLSNWDLGIEKLTQLIQAKKLQKKGLVQQLLTGSLRLTSASGEKFDGEWKEVYLGELAKFLTGKGLSKNQIDDKGKYSCVLYGELYTAYSEVIKKVLSKTNSNEGRLSMKCDVLIPSSTTTNGLDLITASCLLEENILLGGDIIVMRPKVDRLNSVFFSYMFSNTLKKEVLKYTQGVTIIHLYGRDLKNVKIKLPQMEEQTAIAHILQKADKEIELLQQKLSSFQQQKKGLMQVLLTGEKRLIN